VKREDIEEWKRLTHRMVVDPLPGDSGEPVPDHRLLINSTMGKVLQERGEDMSQYLINKAITKRPTDRG
jgi:hypothetical protein